MWLGGRDGLSPGAPTCLGGTWLLLSKDRNVGLSQLSPEFSIRKGKEGADLLVWGLIQAAQTKASPLSQPSPRAALP